MESNKALMVPCNSRRGDVNPYVPCPSTTRLMAISMPNRSARRGRMAIAMDAIEEPLRTKNRLRRGSRKEAVDGAMHVGIGVVRQDTGNL